MSMKTIGLIGGMSWESSIEYYRIINEATQSRLGGLHSARSIMFSVDFAEIEALMHPDGWEEISRELSRAARALEQAGSDLILICTNTMHKLADQVQDRIGIPLLHIADAAGNAVQAAGLNAVGLLGTRFTMEEDFYRERLKQNYGLEVLTPDKEEMALVDDVIFKELCRGIIDDASRQRYIDIMDRLVSSGAEGIILGCTEIGLLVRPEDIRVPLFDTTRIHAETAVDFALTAAET